MQPNGSPLAMTSLGAACQPAPLCPSPRKPSCAGCRTRPGCPARHTLAWRGSDCTCTPTPLGPDSRVTLFLQLLSLPPLPAPAPTPCAWSADPTPAHAELGRNPCGGSRSAPEAHSLEEAVHRSLQPRDTARTSVKPRNNQELATGFALDSEPSGVNLKGQESFQVSREASGKEAVPGF